MFLSKKKENIKYIYIILVCFVGFSYGVGWDYFNYVHSLYDGHLDSFELFSRWIGLIAIKLNNPQYFFIIHAALTIFFFIKGFQRISINYFLTLFIFLTFPHLFLDSFTLIRFMVAFSIIFYTSTFLIKDRRIWPFIIGIICAYNFHHASLAAIFFFIPFFVKNISIKINILIFLICIICSNLLSSFLVNYISLFSEAGFIEEDVYSKFMNYSKIGEDFNNSGKIQILYIAINIVNLFFSNLLYKKSANVNKYITIYNIGCCLMILFGKVDPSMSSRFSIFYLSYLTILWSYFRNNSKILYCVLISCGLFLYIYMLSMKGHHFDFIGRRNCYLPYRLFFFN